MTADATDTDPVFLYRSAAGRLLDVLEGVGEGQLGMPTPCLEWDVQDLLDHLVGGTAYLRAAITGQVPLSSGANTPEDYRRGLASVLAALAGPGALDRRCLSPLGFEWSVGEAVAGTFMDSLIHTWDLARATGQDEQLDPALVQACIDMFLPAMPEHGRAGGLVGPAVEVAVDASPQDQLLAAMGRDPRPS